ncbi:MAG: polysaccharide biosynthesis C-terminal domain-containing protein [Ruminococcus sp.]|nr:polysaccharide biosynthesis C-terminal domain-containing protein [Ruminococcus sp.]
MSETAPKKSSYKKLFSNTVIFAVGSFSSKILVILLVKVYTTYLSRAELGVNDVITQIANWLQPVVTMTISEAVIRFGLDKSFSKKNVFTIGNIICAAGFAILGVIMPIVALSGIADRYLNGYSLLLYVYIITSSLKLLYSTFVRALEKVKLFAFNGILTTFLTLFGTVLFIMVFKMGNTGYLLSIIVSDFLSVIFLTFAAKLWRYLDFRSIDREMMQTMLRYSVPLIPAQLLWLITNSSDSFMTTHYLGPGPNGVLSASYKIPNLVATVYFMFGQAWNMSAILEDDSDDREEFYSNVFNLNQCLLYIIAAGCLMIVDPLTRIWLGPEFRESARYSPILIYSSVFSCFVTFLGSIYLTSKRTTRSLVTSLFSGIINVGLNIILIPTIGLYGPPLSTVASYLVVFIIRAYDSRKIVPFELNIPKLLVNNVLLVIMTIINVLHFTRGLGRITLLLPVLFLVIFLINYKPLWAAVSRLLPKRITELIERIGVGRLIGAAAAVAVVVALSVLTRGWLFYLICAAVLSVSVMLDKPKIGLCAVGGLFLGVWMSATVGAAAFTAAAALGIMFARWRSRKVLLAIVLMADICVGSLFGPAAFVLVTSAEVIAGGVIFRRKLMKLIGQLMYGERNKQ